MYFEGIVTGVQSLKEKRWHIPFYVEVIFDLCKEPEYKKVLLLMFFTIFIAILAGFFVYFLQ